MISYNNKEINYEGCPGCAYAKHEFELDCGMAFENDKFTVSQDWELPIKGFFIVSPKRHIEKLSELTNEERNEMFDLVNKTVNILRNNNICDRFDYIFEEKENRHLHVWILPRYDWMNEICEDIIDNIGLITKYVKENYRNNNVYAEINKITGIIKNELNQ